MSYHENDVLHTDHGRCRVDYCDLCKLLKTALKICFYKTQPLSYQSDGLVLFVKTIDVYL